MTNYLNVIFFVKYPNRFDVLSLKGEIWWQLGEIRSHIHARQIVVSKGGQSQRSLTHFATLYYQQRNLCIILHFKYHIMQGDTFEISIFITSILVCKSVILNYIINNVTAYILILYVPHYPPYTVTILPSSTFNVIVLSIFQTICHYHGQEIKCVQQQRACKCSWYRLSQLIPYHPI